MTEDAITILKQKSQPQADRLDALLTVVNDFAEDDLPVLAVLFSDPDEDPDIRSAIALALGKISGDAAFDLLQSASTDANASVRNYVMRALGMTHREAAAPILIAALQDKDNTIFATASESLGALGHKAVPYLIQLLSDGAEDARCVAAWQLGEAGAHEAVPAIVDAIRREEAVSVIALCIWALGEIGFSSADVLQILSEAKQQPEPDVRLRAETALKKIVRHSN